MRMDKAYIWKRQNLYKVLVIVIVTSAIVAYKPPKKSVLEHITYWNRLRKFATLIKVHNLTHYFERDDITVFVPTTKSYNKFMSEASKFGYNLAKPETIKSFLLYHVGKRVVSTMDMFNTTSITTLHEDSRLLFFNTFLDGDSRVFTVNGARILTANISARNGIVHVIDRYITPLQSPKPVAQFLEAPDLPGLSFTSISMASIVDPALKLATSNATKRFTVLAPNDSFIMTMPKYGQDRLFSSASWNLLKSVFWAHLIEGEVHFIPSQGELKDVQAKAGTIKLYRSGPEVYISNNKVRARIVEPNIPVANGVVHVIDDLLFYVYRNLKQKIEVIPNLRFINNALNKVTPEFLSTLQDESGTITMFLPTDDAFAKLPVDKQMMLDNNSSKLMQLLRDHMVLYKDRDSDSFQDDEIFFTNDSKVLTIHRAHEEVYVEGGNIRAKITVPDIGCTNGIIHLISNVLFHRDFTIWEAVQGNSQLSTMKAFIKLHSDILQTLSSTNYGPLTVLLISDAAFNRLPSMTVSDLQVNPSKLKSAIKGSIVHGAMISSSQVQEAVEVPSMSGHTMTLHNSGTAIYVTGSHIQAKIVIQDIWCSNGILHIIDNILHLPTRTVKDEIRMRPSLSVMTGVLPAFKNISRKLSEPTKVFTMFVPSDQAFTYMPTHRSQVLTDPEVLKSIVQGHIIQGTKSLIEELDNYTRYTSESGGNLFVLKTDHKVSVTTNNARANVIESNIRCTNGILHVVDTLMLFPFETVAETMESRPELRAFYDLLQRVDEFFTWATAHDVQQTVFVPSSKFLSGLSDHHKTALVHDPGIIRRIFEGHFLPGMTLDENYLNKSFTASRVFLTDSRYNTTFTLMDTHHSNSREWVTVDVGFTNLKHSFDLVLDGIACSNGVIYIIDGFLNYPLNNLPEELKVTPNISIGGEKLLDIVPDNSSLDLSSKTTVFTMFVPADIAFSFLSLDDIYYINDNLTYAERTEITERHIIEGQQVTYDELLNGEFYYYLHNHNVSVISRTDGLYLKWKNVETKVIRENILATNGIIHIVDKFLLSTPYQTTLAPTTTKTSVGRVSVASCYVVSQLLVLLSCVITLLSQLYRFR